MANIKKVIVGIKTADDLNNMRVQNFDIFDNLKDVDMKKVWYYKVSKIRIDKLQPPKDTRKLTNFIKSLRLHIAAGTQNIIGGYITGEYWENAIGILGLSNTCSLNIYEIDNYAEWVIAGLNNYKPYRYKLYINNKGAYFNFGKNRYYLNNFEKLRGVI